MTDDLYRYADLRSDGRSRGALRHAVDAGRLRRLSRGIYTAVECEPGEGLRAMFRRLPSEAVVGFHSGARLHGFGDVPQEAIHVIVPAGSVVPKILGLVAHESVLPVRRSVVLSGVPVASAARCAVDLARSVRRMDALPLLDLALRSGACTPTDLRQEVGQHGGLRGVCQARQLVRLADARSECRQESQLRLLLIDGGLPPPEPQLWVTDEDGTPVIRLDLGYRAPRIGIEYDGRSHLTRTRLRGDRSRMNWLAAHGWTMRYYTDRDLYLSPERVVSDIRDVLSPHLRR